jgi:hypothetical protein
MRVFTIHTGDSASDTVHEVITPAITCEAAGGAFCNEGNMMGSRCEKSEYEVK